MSSATGSLTAELGEHSPLRGMIRTLPTRLAAPHSASEVARLLRSVCEAVELLTERDLTTDDAEVMMLLAGLGKGAAMARLFYHARKAHHLDEARRLEQMIAGVGCD